MDKNTVYILQKDCLDAKAGDEFEFSESSDCYSKIGGDCQIDYLSALFVENNPEWFKPKEEVNESKPTEKKQWEDEDDDFLWTNELVMEFVNFHDEQKGIHWLSEDIEKFKQSKSKKEEPQWEILAYNNYDKVANRGGGIRAKKDDGLFYFTTGINKNACVEFELRNWNIHSVKRFPDNTVWSVDDDTQHGKISAFKITGNTMVAEIKNNVFPYDYPLYLSELKAPKEEQVPISIDDREMFSINDIGSCYSSPKDSPLYNQFIIELYQLLCKKINNQSLNK